MKKELFISKLPHLRRHPQPTDVIQSRIETIQGNGFTWTDIQNPDRAEIENEKHHGAFDQLDAQHVRGDLTDTQNVRAQNDVTPSHKFEHAIDIDARLRAVEIGRAHV